MGQNFIDHVSLYIKSGDGGAGSVHFRREKHVPKGGADGGDGGRGGHIILRGNAQMWTLLPIKYQKHIRAKNGENGGKQRSSGSSGKDIYLDVPFGVTVINNETKQFLGEITNQGDTLLLAEGGKGGLGNWHFKSATHQTPRYAQPGIKGIEVNIILELKILADVGLVGFPNAGKSTLLSVLSAAKPKIANYAFTTLTPNLGIVKYRDEHSFVMADIPGIIEGAAEGKGLGTRFLRHIERNSVLLFLISCDTKSIIQEYQILLNELKNHNPELLDKDRVLGISKCDLLDVELMNEIKQEISSSKTKFPPYCFFSSVASQNLNTLKDLLWKVLKNQ